MLTPGRFVGAVESDDGDETMPGKIKRLTEELLAQFDQSTRLEKLVRAQLERLDD